MTKTLIAAALAAFCSPLAAEDLQKQIDDLKAQVNYIKQNYEPSEPVEIIKQVTEYVSPSGELFTEAQKDGLSPTDGSKLEERVTYRKMKFSRRESASEKIVAAVTGAFDGRIAVGLNMVGVYQNIIGAGDAAADNTGATHSANRGAGSGLIDITLGGKPMRNTILFVDLNAGVGPGIDAIAPNGAVLNPNYLSGGNTPKVREAWVLARTPAKRYGLQVGVLDLSGIFDTNMIANDETAQFMTGAFVNSPLLAPPANGPGGVFRADYTRFNFKLGAGDTLVSTTDTADNLYVAAEAGMITNLLGDAQIRLWGRQQPRGSQQPNQALGLSVDHRSTARLTTFARYAKSSYVEAFDGATGVRRAINAIDWSAQGGVELGNFIESLLKERIGAAFGRTQMQDGSSEEYAELYTRLPLTNNFALGLHYQGVFSRIPAGIALNAMPNIHCLGLRVQSSY